jgi:hypothetical protein
MSTLADVTRPFWLYGLNEISGRPSKGLAGWINDEEYQIYTQLQATSFRVNVAFPEPLLRAYAVDINRFGSASFETLNNILKAPLLPKSLAWLVIKTYYAAFFAAHALLRLFGVSCSTLDRSQLKSITKIAQLYGFASSNQPSGGLYQLIFSPRNNDLDGLFVKGSPREAFWLVFNDYVLKLSADVLQVAVGSLSDRQLASTKLQELASNLSYASSSKGRWLSALRT